MVQEKIDMNRLKAVAEKARKVEAFIIAEGAKMGITLTVAQAATFAEVVRRVYEIR